MSKRYAKTIDSGLFNNYSPNNRFINVNHAVNDTAYLIIPALNSINCSVSSFETPQLSLPKVDVGYMGNALYTTGDTIIYGDFDVTFFVDEHLSNYIAIKDWFDAIVNNNDQINRMTDVVIQWLTRNNNYMTKFIMSNSSPTTLSALQSTTTDDSETILTASVTFSCQYMTIERSVLYENE